MTRLVARMQGNIESGGFPMDSAKTETEFESVSWHDCHIWGIEFQVGDPDEGDFTCDLVFSIDFITEWICGTDRRARFRVAPAKLAFHGVTDPRIAISSVNGGYQVAPEQVVINRISRERIADQKVYLDRPYFRWLIELHPPVEGAIEFGAVGFTQTLLTEPILSERQSLSLRERNRRTSR